jgi:AcrR family transcriptional regulator
MVNSQVHDRTPIVDLRRRELIAAAVHVITTQGFEGATVRDIARVAGASVGSVNYYFASKDDLLRAAITETDAAFRALIREAVESTEGCPEKLERILDMCFPVEEADGLAWRVFVDWWSQAAHDDSYRKIYDEANREWIGMLEKVFAEGATHNSLALNVSAEAEAVAFAALIDGLALYTVVTKRISVETVRRLGKDYIAALRPPTSRRA